MDSFQKENNNVISTNTEKSCLEELKDYISNCPDLTHFESLLDDKFLLHFVRGKKYKSDDAIKSLDGYFSVRKNKYNSFFKALRPSTNSGLRSGCLRVLRPRDQDGRVIVVLRMSHYKTSEISTDDFTGAMILIAEEIWNSPSAEQYGCVFLIDLAGFGWSHLGQWKNLFHAYKCVNIFFNNMPIRYKEIHFLHVSFTFMILLNTILHIFPKKFADRIHYYSLGQSDLAKFHAFISPDILPECSSMGGKLSEDEAWDLGFEQRIFAKDDYYQKFSELL